MSGAVVRGSVGERNLAAGLPVARIAVTESGRGSAERGLESATNSW
ncbi:hypothetical protein ATK30_1867 [Amycolatopsis echigonensis]|uniref:Uncharacterized protein n=1 Tax=Amycolatopsis echigonensis TaxID=2576905 RepID=A0A2N3WB55_9PSEU|nr:hypothetical protein ATK30_1867 [Amycolatopsis niigatensis]